MDIVDKFCYAGRFAGRTMFRYFILLLLLGCSSPSPKTNAQWQEFSSREGILVYRALVPINWIRKEPTGDLQDTRKAICEFNVLDNEEEIRITLHTFPFSEKEQRIPPQAQVARWKGQLEDLDPLSFQITPVSHGGFHGLFFEGESQGMKMMGWSMALSPFYARRDLNSTLQADYTIKVTGSSEMINKHRKDLICFANSFECIQEFPSSL